MRVFCLFLIMSGAAYGDSVMLGLRTYHFDRQVWPDECVNEKHNLVAFEKNGFIVGGYKNSHCLQSWLIGYSYPVYRSISLDTALVTGYPDSMHAIGKTVIIPQIVYSRFITDIGFRLVWVPSVLIGGGMVLKF